MATIETLRALCFGARGELKTKPECRATLIDHLILEELMDVGEAEDFTDDTLKSLNLWPTEETAAEPTEEPPENAEDDLSTNP